jgi:hypothetical protein
MAEFPRWRSLEHFSAATAIDFTEGNTFLALLKVRVFFPSFFKKKRILYLMWM